MNSFLSRLSSLSFVARLALLATLAILGGNLALANSLPLMILGTIILGCMFAHAVELQHQCLHDTGLKSKAANHIVGVLLGIPLLSSFYSYRRSHLAHHRYIGTPRDLAFFSYATSHSLSWRSIAFDLMGIPHYLSFWRSLGKIFFPTSDSQRTYAEAVNYILLAVILFAGVAFSFVTHSVLIAKLWLVPMIFVAQPVHFLIELPEHLFCDAKSRDPLRNTRTIIGSPWSSWFTNFNNLHVEHHLYPQVPMEQLRDFSKTKEVHHAFIHDTYFDFYRMVFQALMSKRAKQRRPQLGGQLV